MNKFFKINKIDHVIINELVKNGRTKYSDIATMIGKTAAYIGARVGILKANGIIKGFSTDIDDSYYGVMYYCFAFVKKENGISDEFMMRQFLKVNELMEVHSDELSDKYILKFGTVDFEHLQYIRKKILALPCVKDLNVVMTGKKRLSRAPLIEYDYKRENWSYVKHEED